MRRQGDVGCQEDGAWQQKQVCRRSGRWMGRTEEWIYERWKGQEVGEGIGKKKLRKEIRAELFCHCASSSTKFSGTKMSFSPGGDRLNCSVAPPRGQWGDRLQRQQVLKTSSKNRAGWLYWYLFWVVFCFALSGDSVHTARCKTACWNTFSSILIK